MSIDYDKIQQSINEYGNYILNCIKNHYISSLTLEQIQNIENLLNIQFIVIEKPSNEDIEFFSKQAGVTNPKDYSADYIPSAHGGRAKGDNKIHIYPYTKAFETCKTDDEIIKSCIDNIVVHEIFHYFIRPNLSDENRTKKDESQEDLIRKKQVINEIVVAMMNNGEFPETNMDVGKRMLDIQVAKEQLKKKSLEGLELLLSTYNKVDEKTNSSGLKK